MKPENFAMGPKLIIQIPCFNEEQTIALTLKSLPKTLSGIGCIEYLVINDGSSDQTVARAREAGAHHVFSHSKNLGLATTFNNGIREALRLGADMIVNVDGDNQHCADDIGLLIQPLLDDSADFVIGDRMPREGRHYNLFKKWIHSFGTIFISQAVGTKIPDPPCGFRAYGKTFASRIFVYTKFTYTIETLFRAFDEGFRIKSIGIRSNDPTRPSRLFSSVFSYLLRSSKSLVQIYWIYRPKFFLKCALFCFLLSGAFHLGPPSMDPSYFSATFSLGLISLLGGLLSARLRAKRLLLEELICNQMIRNKTSVVRTNSCA